MRKKKEYPKELTLVQIKSEENHLAKINAKWDELIEEGKDDLPEVKKGEVSFNMSAVEVKWLSYRSDWQRALIERKKEKDKLRRELYQFYTYEHDQSFNDNEKDLFIRTDTRFVHIHDKCERITGLLQFIEDIIKTVRAKRFEVRDFIQYKRYLKGSLD